MNILKQNIMNILKQNVMNIVKQNIGTIILFVYMVVGAFSYNPEEILIALSGLFLLFAGWFWGILSGF